MAKQSNRTTKPAKAETAKLDEQPVEQAVEQPKTKQAPKEIPDHEKPWYSKYSHKAVRPAGGGLMSLEAGQDLSMDFVLVQNLRAGGIELVNSLDECVFE